MEVFRTNIRDDGTGTVIVKKKDFDELYQELKKRDDLINVLNRKILFYQGYMFGKGIKIPNPNEVVYD